MLKIILAVSTIQLAVVGFTLLRAKLTAVLLGPEGVGVISVVDQTVQVAAYLAAFSLPFAAVKFLSNAHSTSADEFRATYAVLLRALTLLTVGGTMAGIGLVVLRPDVLSSELAAYRAILVPGLLSIPAMGLLGFFGSVLAAAQRPYAAALFSLAIAASLCVATVGGLLVGGLEGLYWANLLANGLIVLSTLAYLTRELGLAPLGPHRGAWSHVRQHPDIVTFGLILHGTTLAFSVSYLIARHSVLTALGETHAGLLQAAIGISMSLGLIAGPANGIYLTPIVNRAIPTGEKMDATVDFLGKFALAISAGAMLLVLFPDWLLTVLFSPAFLDVSPVVFLFVIGQWLALLVGVFQALLIGLDDLKAYGIIMGVGYLSLATVAWTAVGQHGLIGVAAGILVSGVVLFTLTLGRLSLSHRLTLPLRSLLQIAYGVLALVVAGISVSQLEGGGPPVFAAKVGGYLVFVAGLLLFLSREDLNRFILAIRPVSAARP